MNASTTASTFLEKRWFKVGLVVVSAVILLSFTLPVVIPLLSRETSPSNSDDPALPDFILSATDGSNIRLSERTPLHSAIVLVFHLGSACQDCRNQLIEYQTAYSSLTAEGAEILAISLDTAESTRAMAAQIGVRFPMLYDGTPVATAYGLRGYLNTDFKTVTMLVDSQARAIGNPVGALAGEVLSADILLEAVRQAIGSAATPS